MYATFRRFLLLQALLLWQGGFVFYSAVVVPMGTDVLGSASAQGEITALVTVWLNRIGLVFLAILAWDVSASRDPVPRRIVVRKTLGVVVALLLLLLFYLHDLMDYLLDPTGRTVAMRRPFRIMHILYLCISTVHWGIGLALAWLTLAAWRAEDHSPAAPSA
jgi:hypothetical protein